MNDMNATHLNAKDTAKHEAALDSANSAKRKRLFLSLVAGAVLLGGAYYAYDVLVESRHIETDNAYVGADVAQVTPLVGGPVQQVMVQDTMAVKRGDILVKLDDTDARLALSRAEADLSRAKRQVRAYIENDASLGAQVAARTADEAHALSQMAAATAELNKASIDLKRRQALADSGSISGEELTAAQNAYSVALANLESAKAASQAASANRAASKSTQSANAALIDDTTVETNPAVLAAIAVRDQAAVDLSRTVIRAPIDGIVSRRQVQVGQRVSPGAMMMVIVPINSVYVDANFKEIQLEKVRAGQQVTLTSDLYGSHVIYHGQVAGFSGGTGAAFAVIPAQNATGNWIKVVQRLPVRITLDSKELAQNPLRVGLSMNADIHTGS